MNDPLLLLAAKRVKRKKNFYLHLSLWVLITIGLVTFNAAVTPRFYWSLIISFIWSIVLVIHAFRISDVFSFYQRWDTYQFEKELSKLNHREVMYLQEYTARQGPDSLNDREFV